jgi:hypothetical protein
MQFLAEYSEAPIQTIIQTILDGCAVFGIDHGFSYQKYFD